MTENKKMTAFSKEDYEKFMWEMPLLPLRKNGKIPFLPDGHHGALRENNIYDFPAHGCNVGLSLPLAHLCCIDVDENHGNDCHGLAELAVLENELGKLPRTLTQRTPNGGIHLIFSDDGVCEHPVGKLSPSIDFKRQGYIVIHPSAIDSNQYEITDKGSNNGFYIAKLPQKYLDKVNKASNSRNKEAKKHSNINGSPKFKKKYNKTIDIERIFTDCNFMKYCKDNASTLSEPMWHSMVTQLAMIDGADALIHELSLPYPRYSYHETQKKIENARKFGFPQSCEYIAANYPKVCKDCKK